MSLARDKCPTPLGAEFFYVNLYCRRLNDLVEVDCLHFEMINILAEILKLLH